ncbi:MAG: S1/P1 nuclease, partial [Congregibacter sp.]|nr:S1/P1 nuclease [Congregibacter sp.]
MNRLVDVLKRGFIAQQGGHGRLGSALLCVLLTMATVLDSPTVHAWGAMQHEIAAQIGAAYLSKVSRQRIRDLLGDESLADASTWADRMRDNPAPFWQEQAGPYHYVTVPPGRRYDQIGPPRHGDAVTALAQFAADLQNPGVSREHQQLALRFAIHIVQDLQQPLHVGNGRDRGGNDVVVQVHDEPSNLHRLWDRQIFESTRRSQQEWLQYFDRSGLL